MNLTAERADILAALTRVSGIVARKTTIPIINNVLIDATSDPVTIRATNLDMEASATFHANISEPGIITVPAQLLFDIVRNLDAGSDLKLATQDDDPRAKLQSGRSKFSLPMLAAKDFPKLDLAAGGHQFTIDAQKFASILADTKFAAGCDAARYYIAGVYMHVVDGRLTCVATDGHRLARKIGPEAADFPGEIMPSDFVAQAERLLKEEPGDATVTIGGGVAIEFGDTRLASKIIDGSYPDYPRVIPNNSDTLLVGRAALDGCIRRAMVMATKGVRLSISKDALAASAKGDNSADSLDEISAEYDGADFEIGCDGKYVLEALAHMTGETAEIKFGGRDSPMLLSDPGDRTGTFVVMPYRV